MIRSMTAYGSGRTEALSETVTVELRTVNSRFLDINLRVPDDLRAAEAGLREKLTKSLKRGKVDVRVNYERSVDKATNGLDAEYLNAVAAQLHAARAVIPDVPAPTLLELNKGANQTEKNSLDAQVWMPMCLVACDQALDELHANREREGGRLATEMRQCANEISRIVEIVDEAAPKILSDYKEKIATRLREALQSAHPEGFAQISGAELSARIAQETSIFSLRVDVAEELTRLRSHVSELLHLLSPVDRVSIDESSSGESTIRPAKPVKAVSGSIGKRLDFLFQEMNREANTLGSKASGIDVTQAAIDLKLLIEQMREQAQNIE